MTTTKTDITGLYFDEAVRTLAEVVISIDPVLPEYGPYDDILADCPQIEQDAHSGLWWAVDDDDFILDEIATELFDRITDNLPDEYWFGYLNEGGGWGIWQEEEEVLG